MSVIATGAEATISTGSWRGREVVVKSRVAKAYRHSVLDARLRDERTRDEANLLLKCRQLGVPVPIVYDINRAAAEMTLEFLDGKALRAVLEHDSDDVATARLLELGKIVARMHDGSIAHGDLTTSNVIVPNPSEPASLVLIDFGLGQVAQEDEAKGVDLHLIEEALEATDGRAHQLMEAFLRGYSAAACAPGVIRRLEAIRQRGRYRDAT